MFWHKGALSARSLKVVTNLHDKEQTAVILTFNEEAQPAVTASSVTPTLQSNHASFAIGIKEGGW